MTSTSVSPSHLMDPHPLRPQTAQRRVKLAGALFLAAFILYGGGRALVGKVDAPLAVGIGTALVLVNSIAVVAIGLLFRPVLARTSPRVANTYAATRFIEAALLATGVLILVLGREGGWDATATRLDAMAYASAMGVLGAGSILFCAHLARLRLVPRALAIFGLVGYAIFSAGALADLAIAGVGLILSIPGGLFELAFGIWLIARGLNVPEVEGEPVR